jgi:hypothetical protein
MRLSDTGVITGSPSTPGNYTVLLGVGDRSGQRQVTACRLFIELPDVPEIRVAGLPRALTPASAGPRFNIEMAAAYPVPVEGEVTLRVSPDTQSPIADVNRADPSVRLSNGQLRASFRLEPGVRSVPVQIGATGTVASSIEISVSGILAGGVESNRSAGAVTQVSRLAPVLSNACYVPNLDGFDVEVSGYSTTRDLTVAEIAFGSNNYVVDLSQAAAEYFSSDDAARTGGTFRVKAAYRLRSGNPQTLGQGSVVIRNSAGGAASRPLARCQ